MRRFFCTTCKRVKRVQHWPIRITNRDAYAVTARTGECDIHMRSRKPVKESVKRIKAKTNAA